MCVPRTCSIPVKSPPTHASAESLARLLMIGFNTHTQALWSTHSEHTVNCVQLVGVDDPCTALTRRGERGEGEEDGRRSKGDGPGELPKQQEAVRPREREGDRQTCLNNHRQPNTQTTNRTGEETNHTQQQAQDECPARHIFGSEC
jgi:hypothetical protein